MQYIESEPQLGNSNKTHLRNMRRLCSIIILIAFAVSANAGDPDILDDFLVPPGIDVDSITRQYFTFTGLRDMQRVNYTGKTESIVRRVTKKVFPALEGLGVSVSKTFYPPLSITPPHYHPRSSELLVALDGPLEIAFIDTRNKLFLQTLQAGDLFVIPRGLIHFVHYTRGDCGGGTMGIFGSANPGTVTVGSSLFESGIKADLLAKAFKTDEETIYNLIKANQE